MRPLWKGVLSFGLVSVPVKLYPATENSDLKFRYLHEKCKTPVQYRKFCPVCEAEVPQEEIVRGYEYEKGRYVILQEEEMESLSADTGRSVNISDFVSLQEIDPIYFEKSYYLVPSELGEKPYALLKKALEETGKVALAKVQLRSKETLAAVRSAGSAMVLSTMYFPEEVRSAESLPELKFEAKLQENEVKMAVTLISSLASKFDPAKFGNDRRKALLKLMEGKVAGEEVYQPAARPGPGKVVDLMEALKASIEMAKKEKGAAAAAAGQRKTRRARQS